MKKTLLGFLTGTTLLALVFTRASAQEPSASGPDAFPPHAVGFRLIEFRDASRTYFGPVSPVGGTVSPESRPMRLYLWYPAQPGAAAPLPFEAFARMAGDDFEGQPINGPRNLSLPVPLAKAFSPGGLEAVLAKPTRSFRDATPLPGRHPLVLIATGLYYESPLTFLSLAEDLAGRGYVVAACPLRGTCGRLVRITVPDLETLVRDLEAVLGKAREAADIDPQRIGLIGYDMGGMAAIIMAMRNPLIGAFVSYDSSINTPHYSGLPSSHPGYDLRQFVIPWIHFTQSRFQARLTEKNDPPTVIDKKEFGDTYLALVRTTNHGAFTTYAGLGIENPVPGFWNAVEPNLKAISRAVGQSTLLFFDAYLQKDAAAKGRLQGLAHDNRYAEAFASFEFVNGRQAPPSQEEWIGRIIRDGMVATLPALEEFRTLYPAERHFDEAALNWLGYHFLYWWGRENDAVALFEWGIRVFPQSGNAFDSLGEAQLAVGQRDQAIKSYRRSLQLNPANENAKAMLERLAQK